MQPSIVRLSGEPAVRFAAAELRRYERQATGVERKLASRKRHRADAGRISLGLFSGFGPDLFPGRSDSPDRDEFVIDIGPEGGLIAGSNPRSVLLGVYRYLRELGFRWVRPGADGQLIPRLTLPLPRIQVSGRASYRHRVVAIEGAVSEKHVRNMVDWLPKVGLNAYYIQFREGYAFLQRWYEHVGNPHLRKRAFTRARAGEIMARLRAEVKKRGLDLHMVGHGWTCEPFGLPGTGWETQEEPIPEQARPYLAEINGKRHLFHGVALNTNLCYGNPEARRIITDAIVRYAQDNPDVDIIHFWLADGSNNQCECPLCRDHRPADLYVRMLNELDAKLAAAGLPTRIVFLIYVDLLWPPVEEKIENPDRFILMFAPITRSYSRPFGQMADTLPTLPPYERNKLSFPRDPQLNLAFLRKWQEMFPGEGFDFDYHFMWDHFKDPGQCAIAQVLNEDVRRLRDLGLDGFISCQVQRVFFPTGLGMTVLAETLWDREKTFDAIADDYFRSAFGPNGAAARRYCEAMSELFDPPLLRGELDEAAARSAPAKLARVEDAVAAVRPAIEEGVTVQNQCHAASWGYLRLHTEFAPLFAAALAAKYRGELEEARKLAWRLFEWARQNEPALQSVFDVFEFQVTIAPLLGISHGDLT